MILIFFGQGPWIVHKNLVWLSDSQWKRIEPQLPTNVRGFDPVDDRCVTSGIAHVQKSGCRWSDCLLEFQPPTTIHIRFVRAARHLGRPVPRTCQALADAGRLIACDFPVLL